MINKNLFDIILFSNSDFGYINYKRLSNLNQLRKLTILFNDDIKLISIKYLDKIDEKIIKIILYCHLNSDNNNLYIKITDRHNKFLAEYAFSSTYF